MKITRRQFLKVGGATGAVGAAWIATSNSWTPKFVRERISEIGLPVLVPSEKPDPSSWNSNRITAAWLGHSTVLINFFGLTILTDPVLFPRVGADLGIGTLGPKRRVAAALAPSELPPIDLVLLSHAHLDHFDMPSLKTMKRGTKAVTASRTGDLLSSTALAGATELGWGDSTTVKTSHGDVEVEAFEVKHWGARWRHDKYRGYNGYVLRREGKSIIFGGDTAYCESFAALKSKGPYELACMPIGAYNPWIYSHCNPEEAVRMANAAGAKHIIPIHHYTFRFGREAATEPMERFEAALAKESERIAVRCAGETISLA